MYDAKNISKVLSLGSSHCHGFQTHLSVKDQFRGESYITHNIKYPRPCKYTAMCVRDYEYDGVMVGIKEGCNLLKTLFILIKFNT